MSRPDLAEESIESVPASRGGPFDADPWELTTEPELCVTDVTAFI